jgi:hypothetical protein
MTILSTQSKLQKLKKQGADALGIFQNTVSNLSDTNSAIRVELKSREDQITLLKSEKVELNGMESQNQTIIDKIQEFLGVLTK